MGNFQLQLQLSQYSLTKVVIQRSNKCVEIFHAAVMSRLFLNPPDRFVSTPGGNAKFVCLSPGIRIVSLQWLVNGSLLENLNLSTVQTEFDDSSGILCFSDIPVDYNMSIIRCKVVAEGSSEPLLSIQSSLILQGESLVNWPQGDCMTRYTASVIKS